MPTTREFLLSGLSLTSLWLQWDSYGGKSRRWLINAEIARRARGIPSIFDEPTTANP